MDLDLFFGRFHPLVVHFPIALLVTAALFEIIARFSFFKSLRSAIPFLLIFGTITAMLSMVFGWFIAEDRGYDELTLLWHRWLGVSVFLIALFLTLISLDIIRVKYALRSALFIIIFFLVSFTGHLGGSLTHGENYLSEYAPEFVRNILEDSKVKTELELPENPDSVIIYKHMVAPILIRECSPCHDATQKKGGLALLTKEAILEGGDNGAIVKPGKPLESELFKRITLPPQHSKFMPLRRAPLSYAKTSIIKWWISNGASFDAKLSDVNLDEIQTYLIRDFHYNPVPKPIYEVKKVEPVNEDYIHHLTKLGFTVEPLSLNNNYVSVSARAIQSIDNNHLKELLVIKDQLTWLDLSSKNLTDDHMSQLKNFYMLTKLNLSNNPISDKGIKELTELKFIESINLFNTRLTNEGIEALAHLPAIKNIYIWKTEVTESGVKTLLQLNPTVRLDTGFQFLIPVESKADSKYTY